MWLPFVLSLITSISVDKTDGLCLYTGDESGKMLHVCSSVAMRVDCVTGFYIWQCKDGRFVGVAYVSWKRVNYGVCGIRYVGVLFMEMCVTGVWPYNTWQICCRKRSINEGGDVY